MLLRTNASNWWPQSSHLKSYNGTCVLLINVTAQGSGLTASSKGQHG